ncbi:glycosyltransferase family 4 protein [Leptolyngbya sp. DQ-M1]|uniref:glycosyltransferase family 4 protein n=1 Tax=Leptolyngbya sp. DQ-M1 TaxID=2933920 RepID=UPI0032974949
MRVAIDVTPWMSKPSGMGLYVANLVQGLTTLQATEFFDLELIYQPRLKNWLTRDLAFPEYLQPYSNLRLFPFPVRISNLFIQFPLLSAHYLESYFNQADIVHGTNYTVFPIPGRRKMTTIYDVSFVRYPEYSNSTVRAYTDRLKKCLEWTDLVLTISHSSKQDIVEYLGVDPSRIWVTHLASRYSPVENPKLELSKPYILFVSTIEPRKNIKALISAFEYLKKNYQIDHELLLIGQKGWLYEPIFQQIEQSFYRSSIRHLSYLTDAQVAQFYQNADVFVYPSHYEGFGMPVLEAMTLGTPVVTSNTSSLPEIAGDAAILVEPTDIQQIGEAIFKVIHDRPFRDRLIQKGKEQAKLYSWEKTAKATLEAYRSIL